MSKPEGVQSTKPSSGGGVQLSASKARSTNQDCDVFSMNIDVSLNCKADWKIYELREDLREISQLASLPTGLEQLLLYESEYKQKFYDICNIIEDSILLTDDEIDEILGKMKLDLEKLFEKNITKDIITTRILSFDKKLIKLYEKINM